MSYSEPFKVSANLPAERYSSNSVGIDGGKFSFGPYVRCMAREESTYPAWVECMQIKNALIKVTVVASWFLLPFSICAQGKSLSLKHGIYVELGTGCRDAPFAAMKEWDGVGFAGPHSSKCTSHILTHHANQYTVETACSALGDGSPNPSGHADKETIQLTRLSYINFVVSSAKKQTLTYRWCSAKSLLSPKERR